MQLRHAAIVAVIAVAFLFACASATVQIEQPPKLQLPAASARQNRIVVNANAKMAANATLGSVWDQIKCWVCKKAIGKFESVIVDDGCGLADTAAAAACEFAGLGPEDPLADVCVAAFIAGCEMIANDVINDHITNPQTLCDDIGLCTD